VLDAPERNYAPESVVPRRVTASPNRKLRRDFSEDFEDDFGDDDDVPMPRRGAGLRLRFRGLPRTTRGRVAAGVLLALCLGLCGAVAMFARNVLLHDERFVIPSSSSIEFLGNAHVTRAQLLSIFGEDVERNIFSVSLAQRRAELEGLPWVAHATVMRLLPNRMRVSIVERTPVAFVRQGSHIGLVDAAGVLLDMPSDAKANGQYSFPVVSGISAEDPLSTRAARMKIFNQFTAALDGSGEKISQALSEVDLSNPEDVRALIPDHSMDILVHFGDTDFLDRYRRFEEHLPEWRTVYPKLSSVDMRYERQVVLEMQPGASVPVSGDSGTQVAPGDAGSTAPDHVEKPAVKSRVVAKHPAISKGVVAKGKVAKGGVAAKVAGHDRGRGRNDVAFAVRTKAGAAKAKPHSAAAKHHPAVVRPAGSTPQYHPPQVVHP
jgi:cell division protein FtsQ